MGSKLFIFIEGDDDERFFNRIIIPMFENKYDINKILIVVREIEGWYLAGMDDGSSKKLGINSFPNTEHINKGAFNDLIPKKFNSRIDFMSEILKLFCIDTAKSKNGSFSYFVENYV